MQLAFFRIAFCFSLLGMAVLRMLHTNYYFSDQGGVPADQALEMVQGFYHPPIELFPHSVAGMWVVQSVFIAALLLLLFGVFGRIGTRLTAAAALLCHVAILQRNLSLIYGADMVSTFWLFSLMFMDSTQELAWCKRKRPEPEWSRVLSSFGLRVAQLQLCIIYGYTGFEKLKGREWWDQTAVWNVLGNEQMMTADLSWLKHFPLIIAAATWGTILFEVYFPALVWTKQRRLLLAAGFALHTAIGLMMGLFFFSAVMLSAYFLFFENQWLEQILRLLRQQVARRSPRKVAEGAVS